MSLSLRHLASSLPFIIGISGHRDVISHKSPVQDKQVYKDRLRATYLHWYSQVNSSTGSSSDIGSITPIWVLTGLAAGADLLAIEVALELQQELDENVVKIIGCLPMPVEKFKFDFDFDSPNSSITLDEFENILTKLSQPHNELIEVKHSLSETDFQFAINDLDYGMLRNSLYLNQGVFIAKYCNVLVALWDGKKAKGIGGTGDIVKYKLGIDIQWPLNTENPALQPISEFDGQTAGLVHHLTSTRINNAINLNINTEVKDSASISTDMVLINSLCTDNTVLARFLPVDGKLYAYRYEDNGEQSELAHFISIEFNTLIDELNYYNAFCAKKLPKIVQQNYISPHKSGLTTAKPIFEAADNIALNAQSNYRKLVMWFFIFAVPGFACYEMAGNFVNSFTGSAVISLTLLSILACWLVVIIAAKRNLKWKYQLARGVAEGIRIRGFLNLSNIAPTATSLIPRRFRSCYPLLNHAILVAELDWWRQTESADISEINAGWLEEQRQFLSSKLQLEAHSINEFLYKRPLYASVFFSKAAKASFRAAIILGVILLLSMIGQQLLEVSFLNDTNSQLMIFLQYNLMLSGLFALWKELSGYEETAKGYQSLNELYCRAQSLLTGQMTPAKAVMLQDLAKEAMFEHVSWSNAESSTDLKQKN